MEPASAKIDPSVAEGDPPGGGGRGDLKSQSPIAWAVVIWCLVISMAEGFDIQAMALAAPSLAEQWQLSPVMTGLLLATSVAGLAAGSFLLSPMGDVWGRRPAILLGLGMAACGTSAGGYAPDIPILLITRFVAGLGLGLAMPVVIILAAELMPDRLRALVIAIVCSGYALGAGIGGSVIGPYIAQDHMIVFKAGGLVTFAALLGSLIWLPESPAILSRSLRVEEHRRSPFDPKHGVSTSSNSNHQEKHWLSALSLVASLFTVEWRVRTLLLWVINFANMALVYFFVSWLPSILFARGSSAEEAASGAALFSFGGVIGGFVMSVLLRPAGPFTVLGVANLITIASISALSVATLNDWQYRGVIALAGATVIGSQFALTAIVNQTYPSSMRATALGYATGAGRVGAMIAPMAGGFLLLLVPTSQGAILATSSFAALAFAAIILLQRREGQGEGRLV